MRDLSTNINCLIHVTLLVFLADLDEVSKAFRKPTKTTPTTKHTKQRYSSVVTLFSFIVFPVQGRYIGIFPLVGYAVAFGTWGHSKEKVQSSDGIDAWPALMSNLGETLSGPHALSGFNSPCDPLSYVILISITVGVTRLIKIEEFWYFVSGSLSASLKNVH